MAKPFSTRELDRKVRRIEKAITKLSLQSADLVPTGSTKVKTMELGEELYRLTDGENRVAFDRAGRVHIQFIQPNDETCTPKYLSLNNTLFNADEAGVPKTHPCMITKGKVTRVKYFDKYTMAKVGGTNYAVSLYGLVPIYSVTLQTVINMVNAVNNSTTNPSGIKLHCMTAAEYALLRLKSAAEAFQARGNTNYGYSHVVSAEHGEHCGYLDGSRYVHVATGTGPLTWRHNGKPSGIADPIGNVWQFLTGMNMYKGIPIFIPNNDAGDPDNTWAEINPETSTLYKAMKPDNSFVDKDAEGTVKYDYTADPGTVSASKVFQLVINQEHIQTAEAPYGLVELPALKAKDGVTVPTLLRMMGFFPLLTGTPGGNMYMRNIGYRVCYAGGPYGDGGGAGFGASSCYGTLGISYVTLGARLASDDWY